MLTAKCEARWWVHFLLISFYFILIQSPEMGTQKYVSVYSKNEQNVERHISSFKFMFESILFRASPQALFV